MHFIWRSGILLLSIGLLAGCAAVLPLMPALSPLTSSPSAGVHTETAVNLSEANFRVVKTNLVGRSKGFRLLGLIGIQPATLTKALDQVYAKAAIQPGTSTTLAHLVVERSSSYFILFSIPKVTVRADVVEFVSGPETNGVAQATPETRPASGTSDASGGQNRE